MRKSVLILFVASLAAFSSCKKDSESEPSSSDSYYPTSKGTVREYKVSVDASNSYISKETMSGNSTSIGGVKFFEATGELQGIPVSSYYGESDGVYKYRATTLIYGISLELEYLNTNAEAGESWTRNVTSSGEINGVPARLVGTLTAKNISKEVLGKTYSNVMHTTLLLEYKFANSFSTVATYDFYTAKGVGVILIESRSGSTLLSKTELKSYTIK